MNTGSKRFTVGLELSYTVEAESADAALRAVLPMVRDAETVAYTVREQTSQPNAVDMATTEPYGDLAKSVYKVDEVAAILGISRNAVYECVPLYSRWFAATLSEGDDPGRFTKWIEG